MKISRRNRQDAPVILCEEDGEVCDANYRANALDDRRRLDEALIRTVGFVR